MSITGPDTFEGAVFRSIDSATRGRRVYDIDSKHKEPKMARRKAASARKTVRKVSAKGNVYYAPRKKR